MDTFHIVAVGPPGSGKTVYLAVLNHALATSGASFGAGVVAEVAGSTANKTFLNRIYRNLTAPRDAQFPEPNSATEAIREVVFGLRVERTVVRRGRPRTVSYPVFDISYVDYAGELPLPDGDGAAVDLGPFDAHLRRAHVLLGVLDGVRLRQYMQGHERGRTFVADHLTPVVRFMRERDEAGQGKIVHFVITKWDVFDGQFTLEQVRERLLADPAAGSFRELVENRTALRALRREPIGSIRLIPVSSVGKFGVLQADWTMRAGDPGDLSSENVELPLAAAVYDVCELAEQRILAQVRRADQEAAAASAARAGRAAQRAHGTRALELALPGHGLLAPVLSFVAHHGEDLVRTVAKPVVRVGRAVRRETRKIRALGLGGVGSEATALYYVMHSLRRRLEEFEQTEPHAMLAAVAGRRVRPRARPADPVAPIR